MNNIPTAEQQGKGRVSICLYKHMTIVNVSGNGTHVYFRGAIVAYIFAMPESALHEPQYAVSLQPLLKVMHPPLYKNSMAGCLQLVSRMVRVAVLPRT
jgi:hypothetical protein